LLSIHRYGRQAAGLISASLADSLLGNSPVIGRTFEELFPASNLVLIYCLKIYDIKNTLICSLPHVDFFFSKIAVG